MFYKKTFFLFILIANINNFCFAEEEITNTDDIQINNEILQAAPTHVKPFSAAIFIDHDVELNLQKKYAITSNLSALFYLQACPLVVVGEHLLNNLINKLDFLKSKSYTQLKYFITIKIALKDFDKNWIVLAQSDETSSYYVLIPKKYIEYFFDLDLGKINTSLKQELENLCEQGKVINQNGCVCKNIEEIFSACGFVVNLNQNVPDLNAIEESNVIEESNNIEDNTNSQIDKKYNYTFINYENLLNMEIKTDVGSRNDFCLNATNYLSNLLRKADETNKWHILISGHGYTSSNEKVSSFCCLNKKYFKKSFKNICTKNVAWICLSSCYLGGPNREIIEKIAAKLFVENMCPKIALLSATDSMSFAFAPDENYSQDTLAQAKTLDLMLFEPINSATTFGVYFTTLIHPSFFKGQNIESSFFAAVLNNLNRSGEKGLILSNWPLILNPNKNLKFAPMENEELTSIISQQDAQSTLQTKNQQIIFLDTPNLKEIKFSQKVPFLLSAPASSAIHIIEKIDASEFKEDIKEFFKKIFINKHVRIVCSKKFFIKELILGPEKKTFSNVYVNQFYNDEEKKFTIDLNWKEISNQSELKQYIFDEEEKDKNEELKKIKDEKKDEWIENFSKTLTGEEFLNYEKKLQEIEQQVRGELSC